MSKLIILSIGLLAGSLFLSSVPVKGVYAAKSDFILTDDSQNHFVAVMGEIPFFDEDGNNVAPCASRSGGKPQNHGSQGYSIRQVWVAGRHLPPGVYTNLPPPVFHILRYS